MTPRSSSVGNGTAPEPRPVPAGPRGRDGVQRHWRWRAAGASRIRISLARDPRAAVGRWGPTRARAARASPTQNGGRRMPERAIPAATSGAQARRTRATDAVRRQARRFAFGTVLVLLALLASDAAHATPEACQSAIERVGHRYARRVLRQVTECSAAERMEPISTCLAAPAAAKARTRLRTRWSKATATVCADTDFASDLGYLGTCAAAPSSCTFATPVLDALGPRNDVLDCLACRIEETLDAVGAKLLANQPVRHACHETIGRR